MKSSNSCFLYSSIILLMCFFDALGQSKELPTLKHVKDIQGNLSPKSVVHNGNGMFFAQNMMYRHTITVYDRNFDLIKIIKDEVELNNYGHPNYKGKYRGAPVECAFSHNGKYAWVSNYQMSGGDTLQFKKPGCDGCSSKDKYDSSFVYKINTQTLEIEHVIKVGAVPKYVCTTPDNSKVLVTNWTSGDLSIIDTQKNCEIKRIKLGTYPRGIVVNSKSTFAYIAVMGSNAIAKVNLQNYTVENYNAIGKTPRHVCLSSDDQFLYISFNGEGTIGKMNLATQSIEKLKVGNQPRSMVLSSDNQSLFVVNYADNTFSKISTATMSVTAKTKTKHHPIGITFDKDKQAVWVACYSGYLQVFKDSLVQPADLLASTKATKKAAKEPELIAKIESVEASPEPKIIKPVPVFKPLEPVTKKVKPVKEKPTPDVTEEKIKPIKEKPAPVVAEEKTKPTPAKPTKPSSKTLKDVTPAGNYYVVVGAFSVELNAVKLALEYQSKGYESFTYFNTKKAMTYCIVQSFETSEKATVLMNEMVAKGTSCWVFVKE